MGYDSSIKIKKKMIKEISDSLLQLDYIEKKVKSNIIPYIKCFKFYKEDNYKYFEGVGFSISKIDNEYYLCGRNSIYASDHDIIKHNDTLQHISNKYGLDFCTDDGDNILFKVAKKPKEGLINGLYFQYWQINNQLNELRYFLKATPNQTKTEKQIQMFIGNIFQNEIYGANICIIHLVTIMEIFYKNIFIVLIKLNYSEKQLNKKFKIRKALKEKYNNGSISLVDAIANSCSFQNIDSICNNFKRIDARIDLKKLYTNRSCTYKELDRIFNQRHENVHLLLERYNYNHSKFMDDSIIVEKAIKKCYRYLCKIYGVNYLE